MNKLYIITVLAFPNFVMKGEPTPKRVCKRDIKHRVVSDNIVETPECMKGANAVESHLISHNIEILRKDRQVVYFVATEENLSQNLAIAQIAGKTYVHTLVPITKPGKKVKKPSGNTLEAKAAAILRRKPNGDRRKHCRRYNHHRKAV